MKKKTIAFSLVSLLFLAFHASPVLSDAKNGCLICHTSDATMKLLYKPPPQGPAEEEG